MPKYKRFPIQISDYSLVNYNLIKLGEYSNTNMKMYNRLQMETY